MQQLTSKINTLLFVRFAKASILEQWISLLNRMVVGSCEWDCSSTGISCRLATSGYPSVDGFLPASACKVFHCPQRILMRIDTFAICRLIHRKQASVTLRMSESGHARLLVHRLDSSTLWSYPLTCSFKVLDVIIENPLVAKYDLTMTLQHDDLCRLCRENTDAKTISIVGNENEISFTLDGANKFIFLTETGETKNTNETKVSCIIALPDLRYAILKMGNRRVVASCRVASFQFSSKGPLVIHYPMESKGYFRFRIAHVHAT